MFTKLFRIRIKIRLKLNILLLWTFFETYYNYLTIDCLYLIKYVLQTSLLRILGLFYERKGKFYSCDHYEYLSPLNNRINFIIVIVYFNLMYFRSKTIFTLSMDIKIKFSWTDNGKKSRNYSFWNLSLILILNLKNFMNSLRELCWYCYCGDDYVVSLENILCCIAPASCDLFS